MKFEDYPALYRSADSGSNRAQRHFLNSLRAEFILLCSLVVATGAKQSYAGWWAASLLLATILTGLLVHRYLVENDTKWYRCRALAESIKTSAWRFACRAQPYQDCEKVSIAVRNFLQDLIKIKADNRFIGDSLDENYSDADQITEKMFEVRKLSWEDRLSYYMNNRVREQRTWYAKKAAYNRSRRQFWFWFVVICYVLIAFAILADRFASVDLLTPINFLLIASTSSIGWLQVKRHGELAASYLLTAHEIGALLQTAGEVVDEETLSLYVTTAEFAFSREHTQWAARASGI